MGKEELYTDISPLPDIDSQIIIDQTSQMEIVWNFNIFFINQIYTLGLFHKTQL